MSLQRWHALTFFFLLFFLVLPLLMLPTTVFLSLRY